MSEFKSEVEKAIWELRETFDDCSVDAESDGSGGAIVLVSDVALGTPYSQTEVWFGFHITYQYPHADVYPHFTNSDLARLDSGSLGEGFGSATFRGQPAIQISRRSNRLNPNTDTAALKLLKVIEWMRCQT